ncbi:MAG: DUF3971 domain-containing protein [Bosea sp. (in: a-proteobacteria)]
MTTSQDLDRSPRASRWRIKGARRRIAAGVVACLVAVLTLLAAAAAMLALGFVPLSGLEQRIATALGERLGQPWQVTVNKAGLARVDGQALLSVEDVTFQHASGARIKAPQALMGYDPLKLLRGEISLRSVDLRGLDVRLGVDKAGALILGTGASDVAVLGTATEAASPLLSAATGLLELGKIFAEGGGLADLDSAGLSRAHISFLDPQGKERTALDNVAVKLTRLGEGQSRLTLSGTASSGQKDLGIDFSRKEDNARQAELRFSNFSPADLVPLLAGQTGMRLTGLPLGGKALLVERPDGHRLLEANFEVGAGRASAEGVGAEVYQLDKLQLSLRSSGPFEQVDLTSFVVEGGDLKLAGSGQLRAVVNQPVQLDLTGSGQVPGIGHDAPVQVPRFEVSLIKPNNEELLLQKLAVSGDSMDASATGRAYRAAEGIGHEVSVRATNTKARNLLALWPAVTSPQVHSLLSERIDDGVVQDLKVNVRMTPADARNIFANLPIPDEAVQVAISANGVRFRLAPGLPVLSDAALSGNVTARSVNLVIPTARVDLGRAAPLTLTEGTFSIADFLLKRPIGKSTFRATGTVPSLATLLASPALKEFAPIQLDPAKLRGEIDLKTSVSLPLVEDLKADEVQVQSTGTVSNVSSETLLGTEKLEGANLALSYDRTGLALRGEGKISGERAAIELKQNAKGQGEATINLVLDQAARQKRGLGFDGAITGPVSVKLTQGLGRTNAAPPRMEIDLTRAAIEGLLPNWTKPAGRAGRLAFTYTADKDGPDLDDLVLESAPVMLKGKVSLDKNNAFESASLTSFKLSPGDDLRVEAKRDGTLTKLTIRGAVADARPFLKDVSGSPGGAQARPPSRPREGDVDLDLSVPILTGFNAEAIGNAVLKLSKRGKEVRALSFDGRIGKSPMSVRFSRQGDGAGQITLQSEDGGATLRYLDLYRRAFGGELTLTVTPGDQRQSGVVLMKDFEVRNEPALRRVLADQGASNVSGDRGAAAPKVDATNVEFTKLRAQFTRSAARVDLREAVLWGPNVGFTLSGNVDYGRDRIDIGGTFVPGYALNNVFSQVPVIGQILGGGQYEGLFAVNFRLSGTASQPAMTVNPLSAIAPGILRRFVDPLGGRPAGETSSVAPRQRQEKQN